MNAILQVENLTKQYADCAVEKFHKTPFCRKCGLPRKRV